MESQIQIHGVWFFLYWEEIVLLPLQQTDMARLMPWTEVASPLMKSCNWSTCKPNAIRILGAFTVKNAGSSGAFVFCLFLAIANQKNTGKNLEK